MAIVDLVMPKLGECIMEATVLKWTKKVGEAIKMDETVLDIATDKVDSEVPSTAEGVLSEVLFNENDVVPIGAVIARITTGAAERVAVPVATPPPAFESVAEFVEEAIPYQPAGAKVSAPTNGIRFYSPLVLNIAAQEGIGMAELENIPGTGNEGRVTKKDILQYVSDKRSGKTHSQKQEPQVARQEERQ